MGVWDVCVAAFLPLSNCFLSVKGYIYPAVSLTRVRRDVFPEPLGPIKSIDGKVVSPLARNTTLWRKIGVNTARKIAIASPSGDGLSRACTQSLMVDIVVGCLSSNCIADEL
jgi:hypothetical protein